MMRPSLLALGAGGLLWGCGAGSPTEFPPPPPPPPPPPTHPTGVLAASLHLAGRPHGVAIHPDGRFVISLIDADAVRHGTVAPTEVELLDLVPVGNTPAHVAFSPDGTRFFTTNQFGNSVTVVDAATSATVVELPLSAGGFNLLVSPDGSRLFVTTSGVLLHVFDLTTLTELATVDVRRAANGLALDPAAGQLYVSSILDNTVTAIATATHQVERVYEVSGKPQRLVLSADRSSLYIASEAAGLEVLDLASGDRTSYPTVGALAVGLAQSPDHQVLYITRPPVNELVIFDITTRTVTGRLTELARPRNVAFTFDGAAAVVTGEGNRVHIIR